MDPFKSILENHFEFRFLRNFPVESFYPKLDSLTELVSEETQTDCNEEKVVTIKTKKGAIYILQNGQLLKDNKLVGEVVINE